MRQDHKIRKPKYHQRVVNKEEYVKGKWYGLDELSAVLPAPVIQNMFRKPMIGESHNGIKFTSEEDTEMSDFEICVTSFSIKIICDFNYPNNETIPH